MTTRISELMAAAADRTVPVVRGVDDKQFSDPTPCADSPAMGMPQALIANLVLVDLTVHGWDLARATGQAYTPDADVVGTVTPFTERMAPLGRERGAFAEMTEFPPDADEFARLLSHTGRRAS